MEAFAVPARGKERRFSEVEEASSAVLRFPKDRLASFTCSFGGPDRSMYEVVGTQGTLRLDPAYTYDEPLKVTLTAEGNARVRTFPKRSHFAPELLYFSECIPVPLGQLPQVSRPSPAQEISRPPVKPPDLVRAESPSGAR